MTVIRLLGEIEISFLSGRQQRGQNASIQAGRAWVAIGDGKSVPIAVRRGWPQKRNGSIAPALAAPAPRR